ncbi:MAG: hypothetical protein CMQ14_00940 [Gammaproteobacteria bacterium]|nr:hypothetical protein [Gammaproteobacteria bacterium]
MSLYRNIAKRRASGKKMRKKGDPGAPSDQDFKNAAKTAKKKPTKKKATSPASSAGRRRTKS